MSKADVLLKKATLFEKMAQDILPLGAPPGETLQWDQGNDGAGHAYLASTAPSTNTLSGNEGASGGSSTSAPSAQPKAQPAAMQTVDKGQQEALSRFLTVERLGIPLRTIDGRLGPETRQALDAFKKYYNQYATQKITSDQQALQLVKYIVDSSPEKYGA